MLALLAEDMDEANSKDDLADVRVEEASMSLSEMQEVRPQLSVLAFCLLTSLTAAPGPSLRSQLRLGCPLQRDSNALTMDYTVRVSLWPISSARLRRGTDRRESLGRIKLWL